ncbi:hypothetical protein [Halovulum sp. GXIMD14793]
MLRTIQTASHISIQGEFVRKYADGRVMVRVGQSYYVGQPVSRDLPKDNDLKVATA